MDKVEGSQSESLQDLGGLSTNNSSPLTPDKDSEVSTKVQGPLFLSCCRPGHQIDPECEVFLEGAEDGSAGLKLINCKKNPGHENFISASDFTKELIPKEWMTGRDGKKYTIEEVMDGVLEVINRTVLINVSYTSANRPDMYHDSKTPYSYSNLKGNDRAVRVGTGFIHSGAFESPKLTIGDCPCPECTESGNPYKKYWQCTVFTATHVIFDKSEARNAVVKCFYDSKDDNDGIVTLFGVDVMSLQSQDGLCRTDCCDGFVCVTHDEKSVEEMKRRFGTSSRYLPLFPAINRPHFIVSHPHGGSKMISMGNMLYIDIPREFGEEIIPWLLHNAVWSYPHKQDTFSSTNSQEPGTSTTILPMETNVTLPVDAKYVVRYYCDKNVITFPEGTKFESNTGEAIRIPDKAEFEGMNFLDRFKEGKYHGMCLYYDIPTCPGTSGAMVSNHLYSQVYNGYTHFGCDNVIDTRRPCNRSCSIDYASYMVALQGHFKRYGPPPGTDTLPDKTKD